MYDNIAVYSGSISPDTLSCPSANYLSGWSHGKEALKDGLFDTLKGSFYINCAFYQGKAVTVPPSAGFPEFTAPNVWPAETSLPGFRAAFEELCVLIIDTAVLVARACDQYAVTLIKDYEAGYLERVVKSSMITKARLLHYFPPAACQAANTVYDSLPSTAQDHDTWCATHIDRKLYSQMYSIPPVQDLGCKNFFRQSKAPQHDSRPKYDEKKGPESDIIKTAA